MSNRNTDRNVVRDILYRAGAEGASLTATRAFASATQGMSVILRQLEDCVLPRRFELLFDGGARVVLEVAERQILTLCDVELPAVARDGGPSLSPGPLKTGDAEALAGLLTAMCRRAGSVRIACKAADDADLAGGGVSLSSLRRAAGVPATPRPQPGVTPWLEAMVDHAKVDVRSAVLIDVDEAHVVAGSKDEAEALADWAVEMLDVFLADGFPLAPELETKGAVTFAPQQNGCHILLAGLRGQFLLALVSGPDTAATLSAWRRVAEAEVDGFLAAS
ncbi:hypothetical protein P6F26_04860 [Roseibacterium sp. SDUM158017]|uniref:hypothetical protein n=1 Tax=Roseicyclus salinarum TaxID=3036773 RepID=UPI0024155113|nr:hypothetical protein [Roseibacterium sp. SDUM158017]MDG4647763.1 hypothetical protein [Roseibacterium sp. SDUM158017]